MAKLIFLGKNWPLVEALISCLGPTGGRPAQPLVPYAPPFRIDRCVTSALHTHSRGRPPAARTKRRPRSQNINRSPVSINLFSPSTMSGYPSRTHARSPRYEREPFISSQRSAADILSPPPTPSYQQSRSWTPPVRSQALTPGGIQRAHSNYTETSYSNYVHEMDEEYLLTERHDSVQKLADMEVESKQEKDQKLKKWVRRFRFVVRVLNLGCRFVPTRSCLIAVSS